MPHCTVSQTKWGLSHILSSRAHILCALSSFAFEHRWGERREQYAFREELGDLRVHVRSAIFSEALVLAPAEGLRISSRPPPASHSRYPGKHLISRQEVQYSVGCDVRDQGGSESLASLTKSSLRSRRSG